MARVETLLLLEQVDLKQKCSFLHISRGKKTSWGQIHTRDITQHWFLKSLCLHQPYREKATFKSRLALANTSQTHHTLSTQMHHTKEASLCQSHVRSKDMTISVFSRATPLNITDRGESLGREKLKKAMLGLCNHQQEARSFSKEMKALFHLLREQRGMGVGSDGTANSEDPDVGKSLQQNQRQWKCWEHAEK